MEQENKHEGSNLVAIIFVAILNFIVLVLLKKEWDKLTAQERARFIRKFIIFGVILVSIAYFGGLLLSGVPDQAAFRSIALSHSIRDFFISAFVIGFIIKLLLFKKP